MSPFFYYTYPSGLRLVYRHAPSPVAYAGIMVGAGTRDEKSEINGMAHYIEHCVFKGVLTRQGNRFVPRTSSQIIHRLEDIGAEVNAYTTKEETVFYAATPTPFLQRTLHLLLDLVRRPTFPKEETDKEKSVILDEIESYNDSPSELIYDDFESLLFSGHPLALPILGTPHSLRRISRSSAMPLQFMQQYYRLDRMVVFVQTRMPFARVRTIIEKLLEADSSTYDSLSLSSALNDNNNADCHRIPFKPSLQSPHEAAYRRHTHQLHLMIGQRAYPLGDKMQLPLYLLNNILGGGAMSSRLNMSLREQKGLVYTVESQYTPLSDTGYWNIYMACDPEDKQQCLELIYKELSELIATPLTGNQLAQALRQLRGQMAIGAENNENNVLAMAKQMLYFNQAYTWQQSFAQLQTVTPNILQQVAQEIFCPERLFILSYE